MDQRLAGRTALGAANGMGEACPVELCGSGPAVVLVEQGLNVAAAMCERAVSVEKGAVRFEGRSPDLLERDDIARAVFLGAG